MILSAYVNGSLAWAMLVDADAVLPTSCTVCTYKLESLK